MSNFQFSLDTLLKIRQAERDAARAALAETLDHHDQLAAQQAAIAAGLERERAAARAAAQAGPLDVGRLRMAEAYQAGLRDRHQQLSAAIASAAEAIDACQQTLHASERAVRTLEKLRDRRRQQHLRGQMTREARHLDEAAAASHLRAQRPS